MRGLVYSLNRLPSHCFEQLKSKVIQVIMSYYAVAEGRNRGIYENWNDCKDQVHQYSGAVYKKFDSLADAQTFCEGRSGVNNSSSYSGGSSGRSSGGSHSTGGYGGGYCGGSSQSYFEKDATGRVNIYTDGACSGNGTSHARAGLGVYFSDNHPENVAKPVTGRITNNSAEIEAVIEAANIARKHNVSKIRINTDSEFLIKCNNEWMPKWKESGWKNSKNHPVVNKEELIRMETAFENLDVKFSHIKGHSGVHGNECADRLARQGAEMD